MKIDLIEQLGGYEEAKNKARELDFDLNNLEFLGGGSAREAMYERLESIEQALLKYRREHNIYEVGDKVVFKAHFKGEWRSGFGEITHIDNNLEGVTISNNVLVAISEIEHATTEEIQAGCRRLDQIKCWSCDKIFTTKQLSENDGFCIHCNAEVCGG